VRRVLLIDRSDGIAEELRTALQHRGFEVRAEDQRWRAAQLLRHSLPEWEFVVIVARTGADERLELLCELMLVSRQFHQSGLPKFLFVSCVRCAPAVRGQIEKLGAQYVRL
jgi:ActR/RegA family two-component response regulator